MNGKGANALRTEWTIVKSTQESDQFPELAGLRGTKRKPDDFTDANLCHVFKYSGKPGDKLKLLKHLWPGKLEDGFEKFRVEFTREFPRAKAPSMAEWHTFLGMIIGAVQFTQRGRCLWRQPDYRGIRGHPDYGKYMAESRFEMFKKVAHYFFADLSVRSSDPWWPIRGGVDGFNANRMRTIRRSRALCTDEAMSAFQPRSSKLGGLPHLSFVQRKPRPLGTEFKCVADGLSGVMLWLEIQEGKKAMEKNALVKSHGANAACALRIALSVSGSANSGLG